MSARTVQHLLNLKPSQVTAIAGDSSLQDALELMGRLTISSLLVIEDGKLVGIISERDYIRKAVPRRLAPWDIKVNELMTREVISVRGDDSIKVCMDIMCTKRIRHLPVVEHGTVIGVISITDVLSAIRAADNE